VQNNNPYFFNILQKKHIFVVIADIPFDAIHKEKMQVLENQFF
jgi:hypothetical protein